MSPRAIQVKNSFMTAAHHMHVHRPVVIWVNHDAQPFEPKNRWH